MGRNEKYFQEPLRYQPERHIENKTTEQSFSLNPFGLGARMCPGKRIAEFEVLLLVANLLRN